MFWKSCQNYKMVGVLKRQRGKSREIYKSCGSMKEKEANPGKNMQDPGDLEGLNTTMHAIILMSQV